MKIIPEKQEIWDQGVANNPDPYGARVYSYAKDWADLMEKRIPECADDAEIKRIIDQYADADSHTADTDGITGFMYGVAVGVLSAVWIHGEHLRRWHNLKTQIGDEGEKANKTGGVLNPALLNVE